MKHAPNFAWPDHDGALQSLANYSGNYQMLLREPGGLAERPRAIEVARAVLARAGCADRAGLIPGDFTYGIADGGDVYVLSRVLHDWDDQQCRALLQRCAEALPA
jgi:hypothetical protein